MDVEDRKGLDGKRQKAGSVGGKDAKLTRVNKHVTQALPDRVKEAAKEAEVTKALGEKALELGDARAGNLKYGSKVLSKVIEFRRRGLTASEIAKIRHTDQKGQITHSWPCRTTLYRLKRENPAFNEQWDAANLDYVGEKAEQAFRLAETMTEVPGLDPKLLDLGRELLKIKDKTPAGKRDAIFKYLSIAIRHGAESVAAINHRIEKTFWAAGRRLPGSWGEQVEAERQIIVFEPSGEWDPTRLATFEGRPGFAGQGAAGEAAAERWKQIKAERKGRE